MQIPAATTLNEALPNKSVGARLLVVDDEPELVIALCEALRSHGYYVEGLNDPTSASEAIRTGGFDVLLSDLMMPGSDGTRLIRQALGIDRHLVGIIMTGQGSIGAAVEAMRAGAFDFILKPFRTEQI
jgi:DNA-binding NtrC family response regulator